MTTLVVPATLASAGRAWRDILHKTDPRFSEVAVIESLIRAKRDRRCPSVMLLAVEFFIVGHAHNVIANLNSSWINRGQVCAKRVGQLLPIRQIVLRPVPN
jgi:hypothetical protein